MNWFKFFRLAGKNTKKAHVNKSAPRLRLEELEVREVPAAPFIVSTTPATGGLLGAPPLNAPERIEIVFSEDVVEASAENVNNYRLFASDGTPVTIGAVTYNTANFTATILGADLSVNGGQLTAGTYSLFLRGDQIIDVDESLPLARPGELVVANAGRDSLSTVSLTGSGLGALSTIPLPAEGTNNYLPSAVASGDLNADGLTDLVVAASGQNAVNVHLGLASGGFSLSPDLTIGLSASPSGLLITELSGDAANAGKNELVVVTAATGNVRVFVNQNASPGSLAFDSGTDYAVGLNPNGITAGKFNDDNFVDLAVSNGTVDASNNYNVNVITGKGDGTFNATTAFIVGNTTPTGVVLPTGIATARLNADSKDDIVVSGTTNIGVLTNTSNAGGLSFTATNVVTNVTTSSITAGGLTTGTGGNSQDIVATTTAGNIVSFVNDGTGTFAAAPSLGAGVATPIGLRMTDLTGDSRQELVYVNGATAGGAVSRAPLFRNVVGISDAVGDGVTDIVVTTAAAHGLSTGDFVILRGITGFAGANGGFTITVTGGTTFTLNSTATLTGNANNNTGTVYNAAPQVIQDVVKGAAGTPTFNRIVVTSANHGLRSGQQITITIPGGNGATGANGTFFVTRLTADTYALNGTENTALGGTYTGGGTWALPVYATGATPTGLTLADLNGDTILDLVTSNKTDNTTGSLSYYTGSGSGGVGDGTFLASTNLPLLSSGNPVATAVGDLNNDGIPDLVATDTKNNAINIFLGLAGGGYGAPATRSLTSNGNVRNPVSVAIGDLNNNGKLDIVVASAQDGAVAVFPGNGDGTFGTYTRPLTNISTPTQLALADVNLDGDLDVLVAHNGKSRGVIVRLGNGNLTFQTSGSGQVFSSKNSPPRATAIAVGDFNRDGNPDFVVTDDNTNGPGTVRIALGDGKGTFPSGNQSTITVGANPTSVAVADFNSDGYVDIATASRSNTTTENITVLLNNLGTGFQPAIHTQLTTDAAVGASVLKSLRAVNVNSDAFIDLVVTSGLIDAVDNATPTKKTPDGIADKDTPNPVNNTYVLFGAGDGSFTSTAANYTVTGPSAAATPLTPLPSAVEVISDPFKLLSTFSVGGTTVSVNLLRNGNFETRALTGEQGNLDGWNTFKLSDTTRGSAGQFLAQTGANSPLSLTTVPPPANGRYRAMLDQQNLQAFSGNNNPNNDQSYAGSHALYQDVTIPANATSVRLSLSLYLNSADNFTDIGASGTVGTTPNLDPLLDYRTTDANQQVRIDIMSPSGAVLDIGTGVRQNLFKTQTNTNTTGTINFAGGTSFDLSAYKGQTIRIRIAATNNQGKLIVGVDDVRVQTVFTDSTAPVVDRLNLRNPTFLSSANTTPQSTDPTIVGKITDNGSINNVTQITFDLGNNGFGGADDVSITTFDANGFFTFTPTTLLPGFQTIPVRTFDQAGNFAAQTLNFILQGPSLTNWQSAGPGPIDISGAGLNYNTVSGKITGIAVDPRDASGNTFYIGSANGGVWKTTDGGKDWLALTDNVTDATGQRINVSVGSLAFDTVNNVIYAATGLDDNAFTSRSSVGILRSADDGRTWTVLGGSTRNNAGTIVPGVFSGARVSKIEVSKPVPPSPGNPAGVPSAVYVAITSWDDPAKAPMILKSSNLGAATPTWTNVLNPANMFITNRADTLQASGGSLASVTDLIVDPFNPQRVIIGLGNIGQFGIGTGAGVWKSIDGGTTWDRIEGGDNLNLANAAYDGTLPFGTGVGRVTLAQGNGRVGDEATVYVMIADVANGDQFNQGGYEGLYKSKDNMLNFTKVMLKQPGLGHARFSENYEDIELLGNEGGNVGALVVDPSNANVVYVGGSRRFTDGTVPQHAFIRVDTGNMRDTDYVDPIDGLTNDGDDRDKAGAAAAAGGTYPTGTDQAGNTIGGVAYAGEGVYWYDIEQAKASDSANQRRLPASIQRLVYDTQGRLLIGTENGLFRGVPLGFGYDFRSSFAGILAGGGGGGGGGGQAFNPPGMTITDLNGNLQITDLTSVAIDPTDRNRLYISASGVGTALTAAGVSAWQSTGAGLTGPTLATGNNIGVPNAFQVLAANLAPDAPADAITTLYRTWQYRQVGTENSLIPEVSPDAGGTFSTTGSAGISSQDTSDLAPVLAINPIKSSVTQSDGSVVFFDELLFGTNKVYSTRTGGAVWDAISGQLGAGFISALAFSPNPGEYLAGTSEARVFIKTANTAFIEITGTGPNSLATLIGSTLTIRINGITVDPSNPNSVYVMAGTPNGRTSVFRGTLTRNASGAVTGATWAAVTGGLPLAASYKMVIDRRPSTGAPNGRFYVGTDRGVFTSTNGTTWTELGQGLPAAPVVDLQFNPNLEVLAAATQGRGVFTLSTARSGPAIVNVAPTSPTDDGPLTQIDVTFNTPVDPRTFNADSNNAPRTLLTLLALNSTDFATTRIKELVQQYHGRVANDGDIKAGLGYFFKLNGDGSISQQFDAKYGVLVNTSLDQGELNYVSFLTSNNFYYTNLGGGNNAAWIEKVWQDFFFRTATGDSIAAGFLNDLNTGATTRLAITQKLTGTVANNGTAPGPTALANPLNVRAREFHTNLVASLFNKLVARNYPASGASSTEITGHVDVLARGGLLRNVIARIISTTEAYQKMGNDYALPAGVTARAVTLGNLTGSVGGGTNAPILDLIVAGSDDRVRVYKGKVGGGYSLNPDLILNLQTGSNAADVTVADIDADGKLDLAVANSGLTSNSVSVFYNDRATVGTLSASDFTRVDLDGGNNPISVAVGNANNDTGGLLDIVTANRTVNGANNYTASILVGLGSRTFSGPTQIKVGDNTPNGAELVGPTDLAFADVTVDGRPDLIVSGDNGVVVLLNTTSTTTPGGTPTFSPVAARLTSVATTSIAAANLDSDTDLDIVATSASAAGEVHVFRNNGAGAFTESIFAAGNNPSQVQLVDMTGDGKNDIVVVNDVIGGGLSVLNNTTVTATSGPDTLSFAAPLVYPLTGSRPAFTAAGDTNQDGLVDLAIGYRNSEFVSSVVGQQQGFLRVATDPNWLDWVFRSLAGRPYNQAEFLLFAPILGDSGLAYLNGPFGIAAPLSITPTDSSNLTFTLTFAPRVFDGGYRLFIGPNSVPGLLVKDFIDQNGSYLNTGNPMNQNQNATNGETPVGPFPSNANQGDRFTTFVSVNNNDNGRFVTNLYTDFQGTTGTNGRDPDQAGFIATSGSIEAARLTSLNLVATSLVGSAEEVDALVTEVYQRYLRRAPGADLTAARTAIQNGTLSLRQLVVNLTASNEYYTNAVYGGNSNDTTWITALYRDVLPGTTAVAYTGTAMSLARRTQIANGLVFSDAALQQTVTEYMLKLLGRAPVRNSADPKLDETTGFPFLGNLTTDFMALLRSAPTPGQLTGDQRLIVTVVSSGEYLRVRGNSNFEWLKSLYTRVLGRSTIDTTGAEFTTVLNTLLTNYTTQRQTALTTIINSREFRDRFYTDYYTQFLSGQTFTQADLDAQETFYQANGLRLEAVVANLMRSNAFSQLSGPGSSNSAWLEKVYSLLLGRDTSGDSVAANQLARLNAATQAQLANVRYTIALEVLNATAPPPNLAVPTYRQLLITKFYQTYLGRTPTTTELNNFVGQMNAGNTQQTVLINFLRHAEYFLHSQL